MLVHRLKRCFGFGREAAANSLPAGCSTLQLKRRLIDSRKSSLLIRSICIWNGLEFARLMAQAPSRLRQARKPLGVSNRTLCLHSA